MKKIWESTYNEDGKDIHCTHAPTCLALVHCDFNLNFSSFCRMLSALHLGVPRDLPPWAVWSWGQWRPQPQLLPGKTVQSLDEVICPWAVLLRALHQWHGGKDDITGQELMLEAKMNAESLYAHVLHPATGGRDMAVTLRAHGSVLKLWVSQARWADVLLFLSPLPTLQYSHSDQRLEGVRRPDITALQAGTLRALSKAAQLTGGRAITFGLGDGMWLSSMLQDAGVARHRSPSGPREPGWAELAWTWHQWALPRPI